MPTLELDKSNDNSPDQERRYSKLPDLLYISSRPLNFRYRRPRRRFSSQSILRLDPAY